jgi:hypothetical protein
MKKNITPKKCDYMVVRMTREQKETWKKEGKKRKLSLSAFVRLAVIKLCESRRNHPIQIICFLCLVGLVFTTPAFSYTDEQIVSAIYQAEGGAKAQFLYGIRSIKCSGDTECRKICFNTVKNNRKRFADYGFKDHPDFISFLSARYCPIGANNDPQGLNKNWQKNVRYFLDK